METEQEDIQATEAEKERPEALQPTQSLGSFLQRERERLGLSREQITEMTRMRTQVIQAIENEIWAALPPAVFVKGFLRSYAKVLGVSQETVMGLYAKSAPAEGPSLAPPPEPPKSRRREVMLVLLGVVMLAAAYGSWQLSSSFRGSQGWRQPEKRDQTAALPSLRPDREGASVPSQSAGPRRPLVREAEEAWKQEPSPEQSTKQDTASSPVQTGNAAEEQVQEGGLSLTGVVKERTWLRIRIDGKEEKEYLFQPGARPQWKGKESFYLLIGNAAGIEFELNGKRVGPLGSPGQVIRLTLPLAGEERERNN